MNFEMTPRYDTYRVFVCSDCDPTFADDDDTGAEFDHAYEVILPVDGNLVKGSPDESGPIDRCPRCDSYLSLCCDDLVVVERKPR